MVSFFEQISEYNVSLEKILKILEAMEIPAGMQEADSLKIRRVGMHCAFYLRKKNETDRRCTYIRKDDPLLQSYVNRRFRKDALRILRKNISASESFLNKHSGLELETLAASYPEEFQQINRNLAITPHIRKTFWENEKYESNDLFPENKVHVTKTGISVRSKSEAMIADVLTAHKLLWRYECRLEFGDGFAAVYPDFTIYDPNTDKTYFWEHLGMMDESSYADAACKKIRRYQSAGLLLGRDLILTMETRNVPFSSAEAEKVISRYFSGVGG